MRYREVIIDGRVFLEIVEEHDDLPATPAPEDEDEEAPGDRPGVWIGELVPYH